MHFANLPPRVGSTRSFIVTLSLVRRSSLAACERRAPEMSVPADRMTIGWKLSVVADAGGERGNVAHLAAVTLADDDLVDADGTPLALRRVWAYSACAAR